MGIVNLTPDSFYDGGKNYSPVRAVQHSHMLVEQGAHILDLGAESSRPGADPVSPATEQARLLPVLRALHTHYHADTATHGAEAVSPLLSVDTYHAATARAALTEGAHIINDISACRFDPALLDVLLEFKPGYVLMHSQGEPKTMQQAPAYTNTLDEVLAFFERHLTRLVKAGLPETHIVLDPGIGFGKCLQHNMALLRGIARLAALGRPVLMALSMKSLFRDLLDLPASPQLRATATQVATALLAAEGVSLHRVHDVKTTAQTLYMVQAFRA